MNSKITLNPYVGKANLYSKYDRNFEYKSVKEYSLEEWEQNIFIVPCENLHYSGVVSFLDKRSGIYYSLMSIKISTSKLLELRRDCEMARKFIQDYWLKNNSENKLKGNDEKL